MPFIFPILIVIFCRKFWGQVLRKKIIFPPLCNCVTIPCGGKRNPFEFEDITCTSVFICCTSVIILTPYDKNVCCKIACIEYLKLTRINHIRDILVRFWSLQWHNVEHLNYRGKYVPYSNKTPDICWHKGFLKIEIPSDNHSLGTRSLRTRLLRQFIVRWNGQNPDIYWKTRHTIQGDISTLFHGHR